MNINNDLTLDKLISSLTLGMDKAAEDCDDKGEKKEDKEKKDDKAESKKEDKSEKKEDKDEDEKKEGNPFAKSASELGAEMAREIMAKAASKLESTTETPMNKQAQTAGQALAATLLDNLQKRANAGDLTNMTGGPAEGAAASKVQMDAAAQVAEGEAAIKPMVTGDGIKNTGTINEIFDAMVADALAQGAAGEEQVHATGQAAAEGGAESGVPNQVKVASAEDELEKAAAISTLVESGVNFDDAVELVKQAAIEIEFEMEKSAAMTQLMAEGVSFDEAIELVKQASAGDITNMSGGPAEGAAASKVQMDAAAQVAEGEAAIKPMVTGDGIKNTGTINQIFDAIVADAMAQGATGEEQVHATGIAHAEGNAESGVPNQVKVAAIEKMVAAGVDFDEAVEFVKEASLASMAKAVGSKIKSLASDAKVQASRMIGRDTQVGGSKMGAAKALAKNPLVAGGAVAAGGAGAAMAMNREKKAAFDALVEAGVDFNEAAVLVAQKAQELYGE